MSVFWLILAIALWGLVHSILASLWWKGVLARWLGPGPMRFYRLAYNVFSIVSFLPILWLMAVLPDRPFYRVPAPWSYLMLLGQALGIPLLAISVFQTDMLSFAGLRQLVNEERPARLVTDGLYRYVRHPQYSLGLLILWLTPVVTVNRFTFFVGLTLYILVGAWFDERKLLREFGAAYAQYRRATPMLVPGPRWRRE